MENRDDFSLKIVWKIKLRRMKLMGNLVHVQDTKNAHYILAGILNVKRSCRRTVHRWEDNIHIYGFDSTSPVSGSI
jgi:hypothetical protein